MTTFFMPEMYNSAFTGFLNHLKFEKRYSSHTVRAYADDLQAFHDFTALQFEVDFPQEITPQMIRSWMASLTVQKIQPRSINRKISSLKSFFKYCMVQGAITVNPVKSIQVLKTKKRLPSYIEQEQMEILLNSTYFPNDFEGLTEYLVLIMLYETGIRVSELSNLKISQIDSTAMQLKVLGKGNKERVIPINKFMIERIDLYKKERASLFPEDQVIYLLVNSKNNQLTSRAIYSIVKKYLSLITTADRKSPHVLRHSFATHLTNNGAELNAVKELLGHSSLASTQVYTHNSIERLRDIHRKAHPKG
jgi:integrase/recombinase XerC